RSTHLVHLHSHHTTPPSIYTLSLHDALPICRAHTGDDRARDRAAHRAPLPAPARDGEAARPRRLDQRQGNRARQAEDHPSRAGRSEEHTSELQSLTNLVCRLLLEKKKHTQLSEKTKWEVFEAERPKLVRYAGRVDACQAGSAV